MDKKKSSVGKRTIDTWEFDLEKKFALEKKIWLWKKKFDHENFFWPWQKNPVKREQQLRREKNLGYEEIVLG